MNIDVVPTNGGGMEDQTDIKNATSLFFQSKQYGSQYKIEFTTDSPELGNKLGVANASGNQGTDAEVTIDTGASSGFSKTATTFIEGAA